MMNSKSGNVCPRMLRIAASMKRAALRTGMTTLTGSDDMRGNVSVVGCEGHPVSSCVHRLQWAGNPCAMEARRRRLAIPVTRAAALGFAVP